MAKRYQISEEQVTELTTLRKSNKNKNVEKRIKVLLLHADGEKCEAIASKTGYAKSYISQLVSRYCNQGISAINGSKYGGNHRNLSFEQEAALLEPFRQSAQAGQIVEVSEIKCAYENAIGRSLDNEHGLIYYVLHRHGWRKVMPRSKHPKKASEEAIEASKKLTQPSGMRWKILQAEESD